VVEVDLHGQEAIGIVKADFNSVNELLVDVAGTVYRFHETQIRRALTTKDLVDRYPHKGSMPMAVITLLYELREREVERLSRRDVVVVADVQSLDRSGRAMVAMSLFAKCDVAARNALVHDEHPQVRSCAVLSQLDLQAAS
jgi:hypothetical protein